MEIYGYTIEPPVLAAVIASSVTVLISLGNIIVSFATLAKTRDNGIAVENFKFSQTYLTARFTSIQSAWELLQSKRESLLDVSPDTQPTLDDSERIMRFRDTFSSMLNNGRLASSIYSSCFYHLDKDLHGSLRGQITSHKNAVVATAEAESNFNLAKVKLEPTYDLMIVVVQRLNVQAREGQLFLEAVENVLSEQLIRYRFYFESIIPESAKRPNGPTE